MLAALRGCTFRHGVAQVFTISTMLLKHFSILSRANEQKTQSVTGADGNKRRFEGNWEMKRS